MFKRLFALVLCLTLLCCGAQASFLGAYDTLRQAYDAGGTVEMSMQATIDEMEASAGGLTAFKSLIEPMTLTLSLRGKEQALALKKEERTLLSLAGVLTEGEGRIPALQRLFSEGLPILYDTLAQGGKTQELKKSVSIKNVGSAGLQTVYEYTTDEANAALPTLKELLLPYAQVLTEGEPYQEAFLTYLSALSFTGKLTVKRFKSKDGADMGLQVTCRVTGDGKDKRAVTIFGGYQEGKGAYVSFACPAASGNNQFKTVLSYAVKNAAKQDTLTLTLDTTRRVDKDKYIKALDISLKSKPDGETRRVTGSASLSTTVNGVKTVWTAEPDLNATADSIAGAVTVTQKTDKLQNLKITLNGSLQAGSADAFTGAETVLDLSGMTDAEALKALAPVRDKLLGILAEYVSGLSETDAALLTHLFRTDAWMNGPVVPADGGTPDSDTVM